MKVGISTACFNFNRETESAAATIRGLGADCAEIYLRTFYEYRPEFAKTLLTELGGLEVASVSAERCNFERQTFSPSRRIRGDGFYWLDKLMTSAKLLNCNSYAFRGCDGAAGVADYGSLAAYLRETSHFCARFGVELCLENCADALYNRPYVFREIKKFYPELCGVFNLEEALKAGYPCQMFIADMAESVAGVKLSDRDLNGNRCLPGEGVIDFEEILKRLNGFGFDGAVIIEADNFADNAQLKRSFEFIKELIYKIN